ncbi:hypothetical protein L596_015462 [Steinernema carpocapsae]|uniref:Uncharacterized protein n=1 Tax=Steinernema carpocapsae TaxID=34508 RepID=A0A4U5NF23_STECR|nr:hypothetical protein L596_015462 [Steinernema carpocapsae]
MPKQEFEFVDMMGPLVAAGIFIVCLFLLSVCINFTCIKEDDDRTVYEKFGSRWNIKLGVHTPRRRLQQREKQRQDHQKSVLHGVTDL